MQLEMREKLCRCPMDIEKPHFFRLRTLKLVFRDLKNKFPLNLIKNISGSMLKENLSIGNTCDQTYFWLDSTFKCIVQWALTGAESGICSGPWNLGSWCRLSKAHNYFGETRGGSGNWKAEGMGREWEGGCQFTSNLGPRWTGSHHTKGGILSK